MTDFNLTGYSEDTIASQFSAQHTGLLKYCETLGKWFLWDGTRWRRDDTRAAVQLVRVFVRGISDAAAAHDGPRRLASAAVIKAIEQLAKSDPRHAVRAENLDSRLWEINTPDGTVDLETGVLALHDPAALHTKITRCSPGGACPTWLKFLDQIFAGDQELVDYVQRVFGHMLTGSTREQAFFFAHGIGGNGKSVLLNTVRKILNDYAYVAPPETFLASKFERHPTELFALRGARLVISQETEANGVLAEARLKMLTGSDGITARGMRRDPMTFEPQCKLVIATNHLPRLQNVTEAMRRRLQIIPFSVIIPLEMRDQNLEERLLKEAPGILAWAIEGCLKWQRLGGLRPPSAVTKASNAYFDSQDPLAGFIDERCELDPTAYVASSVLYDVYTAWADDTNQHKLGQSQFRSALINMGITPERRRTNNGYKGLRLKVTKVALAVV